MNEASFSLYDCIRKYTAYTKVISNADTVMIALLPGSRINLDKTTNIDPLVYQARRLLPMKELCRSYKLIIRLYSLRIQDSSLEYLKNYSHGGLEIHLDITITQNHKLHRYYV